MYFDKTGKEISLDKWYELQGDQEYKRVGLDTLPNGYRVSTVWLGINQSHRDGPPLTFETMVFGPNTFLDLDMTRYSTLEEATAGHADMVARWQDKPNAA
jgi:hypothetical protein